MALREACAHERLAAWVGHGAKPGGLSEIIPDPLIQPPWSHRHAVRAHTERLLLPLARQWVKQSGSKVSSEVMMSPWPLVCVCVCVYVCVSGGGLAVTHTQCSQFTHWVSSWTQGEPLMALNSA